VEVDDVMARDEATERQRGAQVEVVPDAKWHQRYAARRGRAGERSVRMRGETDREATRSEFGEKRRQFYRDLPQFATTYDEKDDLHSWMVENMGVKETDPFAQALGSARDAAKSVTHATDYGEGLQLIEQGALRSPRIKREVEVGARVVYPDWRFQVVSARRGLFDKRDERRRRGANSRGGGRAKRWIRKRSE